MIQSHVTKMDLTPVKTAAEAKFLSYLSPLSIGFRMLYHTTDSNKNSFFRKLGHMSDDVIFMSRDKKNFLLAIIMRTDKFHSHIYEDLSIKNCLVYQNFKSFEGGEKFPPPHRNKVKKLQEQTLNL